MIIEKNSYQISEYIIDVFAFSKRGTGKIENQDSFKVYYKKNQLIIAVADGLGSAAYSKEGSQKIVSVAPEVLSQNNSYETFAHDILIEWKNGLEGNLNQYDTTLKFIKITEKNVIFGGVGDGWIALSTKDELVSLTMDNSFSNQTDSILSHDLKSKFVVKETSMDGLYIGLISTDGFSEDIDKENAKQMLDEIDREMFENADEFIVEMKNTLEKWPVETNHDDKTVIFIKITKEEKCG